MVSSTTSNTVVMVPWEVRDAWALHDDDLSTRARLFWLLSVMSFVSVAARAGEGGPQRSRMWRGISPSWCRGRQRMPLRGHHVARSNHPSEPIPGPLDGDPRLPSIEDGAP
jgi:hypothetical protein